MPDVERPTIPEEDMNKAVSGGNLPPLELLPDRQWLGAKILDVEYRVCVFNNQVQYLTKKVFDEIENKEIDEQILDNDGKPIPRREFCITFQVHNYTLPNGDPRRCWLQLGASLGENAHLPTFLGNTLGWDNEVQTPKEIIDALKGLEVRLQLANKPRKDKTKPPYQKVIYDAVESIGQPPTPPPAQPITEEEVAPETTQAEDPLKECGCSELDRVENPANNQQCKTCGGLIVRWDE
jgi:hypothetical protein